MKYCKYPICSYNLLLYLAILFCWGCKDQTPLNGGGGDNAAFHLRVVTSPGSEPMAFFQYEGVYNIFYPTTDESATDKRFGIARTTSKDLIHWSEKQTSFLPGIKPSTLHGGIIIDSNNTTGYGTTEHPPLIAVLTGTLPYDSSSQGLNRVTSMLAYSKDGGDSWSVDTTEISLPKVLTENPQHISMLWFGPASKWIMTIAVNDHVEFFSSTDLRTWAFESKLGAEFFPDDLKWNRTTFFSAGGKAWILLADIKRSGATRGSGGTVYFVGDFDGHQFVNRSGQLHWLDYGEDIYGSLLAIASDGRRINLGWKNPIKQVTNGNNPSAGMTILPRELAVEDVHGETFIRASPPRELTSLYAKEKRLSPGKVSYKAGNEELISGVTPPFEFFLKFNTAHIQKGSFPTRVGVSLWNNHEEHLDVGFDRFGFYYLDTFGLKTSAATLQPNSLLKMPFDHTDSTMDLHIIVDSSTIECFAEGGKLVMTSSYTTAEPFTTLKLFALNGEVEFTGGRIIELDTRKK